MFVFVINGFDEILKSRLSKKIDFIERIASDKHLTNEQISYRIYKLEQNNMKLEHVDTQEALESISNNRQELLRLKTLSEYKIIRASFFELLNRKLKIFVNLILPIIIGIFSIIRLLFFTNLATIK